MPSNHYPADLVALMFPNALATVADLEARFPKRPLPPGAIVTRFAPSPTGSMHIGGVYTAMLAKDLARHSAGTFFVRIEDTDQERKTEGALEQFATTFAYFDIEPDVVTNDIWGPYVQSERADIYLSCIKSLVEAGRAYPCFCTKEELDAKSKEQSDAKLDMGYYGEFATCRHLATDVVRSRLTAGHPYVIRFRSPGGPEPVVFEDLIRGTISAKDNVNDVVILKSSASALPLPTYHMAHAVDDHFMRVSLIVRSDEWLSSVPVHLQLFDALGFERIPYAHTSPLMKVEGTSRRKLSKRKDPEASVSFYMDHGYPAKAVALYLRGIANSRLQDMDAATSFAEPIRLDGINKAGALLDMKKLDDVSSNFIATMTGPEIRAAVTVWAQAQDPSVHAALVADTAYVDRVIDTDRFSAGRVRKDLKHWSGFAAVYGFFFDALFVPATGEEQEKLDRLPAADRQDVLNAFLSMYQEVDTNEAWMKAIADIAVSVGFARDNKEYKANPSAYRGSFNDAVLILRVVITGRSNSPSLFEVMRVIGIERIRARVGRYVASMV